MTIDWKYDIIQLQNEKQNKITKGEKAMSELTLDKEGISLLFVCLYFGILFQTEIRVGVGNNFLIFNRLIIEWNIIPSERKIK